MTETRDGVTLPSYRGDLVNSIEFTEAARIPDPERLLKAHYYSAMTMNFVRSLVDGGFADVHHTEYWDLSWVEHSPLAEEFHRLTESLGQSLRFMETITGRDVGSLRRVDFFTSHEALHLHYEQAQTRQVPRQWGWFNLGHAFSVDRNAHGGPGWRPRGIFPRHQEPAGHQGRARHQPRVAGRAAGKAQSGAGTRPHGADPPHGRVADRGQAAAADPRRAGYRPSRCCGFRTRCMATPNRPGSGIKTRRFRKILREMELAFEIHRDCNSRLGGVHLELTGENVTECTGGARDLSDEDLTRDYKSTVDPRLNYEQSLELAMLIVRKHKQNAA